MRFSASSRRRLAVAAGTGLLAVSSLHAIAQTPSLNRPDTASAAVTQACESAARESLNARGLAPAEVTLNGAPTVDVSLSNESQVVLRGNARVKRGRESRSIGFSCNVDRGTLKAGVMIRDTTPIAAASAPARPPVEPDLSALTPAACESSAAEALKRRWPLVSQITFDSATRRLQQPSVSRAELHGTGSAMPVPRAPETFFTFDCELDPRDGRVLRVRVNA